MRQSQPAPPHVHPQPQQSTPPRREPESIEPLVVDLLRWLGRDGRPYPEVMDAWKTSCPRLPVWEEANDRGLVERKPEPQCGGRVFVTPRGSAWLEENAH